MKAAEYIAARGGFLGPRPFFTVVEQAISNFDASRNAGKKRAADCLAEPATWL
jgi:hypothetical protein